MPAPDGTAAEAKQSQSLFLTRSSCVAPAGRELAVLFRPASSSDRVPSFCLLSGEIKGRHHQACQNQTFTTDKQGLRTREAAVGAKAGSRLRDGTKTQQVKTPASKPLLIIEINRCIEGRTHF